MNSANLMRNEFRAPCGNVCPMPRPVVLASASPRRQELLKRLVPIFEVDSADVDETPEANETPWHTAQRLAKAKAEVVLARHSKHFVIAGDTVVAILMDNGHKQLAKPADYE